MKHEAGWAVTGHPADELAWTSPTGHTYRAPPGRYDLPGHESAGQPDGADTDGNSDGDDPPF